MRTPTTKLKLWFSLKAIFYSFIVIKSENYEPLKPFVRAEHGVIAFPVGWRNVSLCFARLHFDSRLNSSLERQARQAAEGFCNSVPFESFVNFGDSISKDGVANMGLWCDHRYGLPTIMLDANDDDTYRDCAACARDRCVDHLSMALIQRVQNTVLYIDENDRAVTLSRSPEPVLPRRPMPMPRLQLSTALGGYFLAPSDGTLHSQTLHTPLRVVMWPKLYDKGFFRERKLVLSGIDAHPNLRLIPTENKTFWTEMMSKIYDEPMPQQHVIESDIGKAVMSRLERRKREHGLGEKVLSWLEADLVVWVVDHPSNSTHISHSDMRYIGLIDPRGLIPASRLVIIDFRDGGARTAVSSPPSERIHKYECSSDTPHCGFGEKLYGFESTREFVRQEKCALYFERSWYPRKEGVTLFSSQSRLPSFHHRVIDFSVSDEFLRLDQSLSTMIPFASHLQYNSVEMEDVEAKAWEFERPLKLVCLLRPSSNMPCRVKLLRWVAELCLELQLSGECFVGQWSDVLRDKFDTSYFNLLRRAQIVVTQKPCDWYGDYRMYEALSSGGLVVMDQPQAEEASLLHGIHGLFFDPRDENVFKSTVKAALAMPLTDKYRMARDSHLFALRHYRDVSRMDGVFTALTEVWSQWPGFKDSRRDLGGADHGGDI